MKGDEMSLEQMKFADQYESKLVNYEHQHKDWLAAHPNLTIEDEAVKQWHRQRVMDLDNIARSFVLQAHQLEIAEEDIGALFDYLREKAWRLTSEGAEAE